VSPTIPKAIETTMVFSEVILVTGVWKIDFKRDELTFASTIDSLKGIIRLRYFR
jgi:hypothetical protein